MASEDFFQRANLDYLEQMYQKYQADPNSVDPDLRFFFQGFDVARTQIEVDVRTGQVQKTKTPLAFAQAVESSEYSSIPKDDQSKVIELIEAYRRLGHQNANLSPIGGKRALASLDLFTFGLHERQLDTEYFTGSLFGPDRASLREIISYLEDTYCGNVGVEMSSIEAVEEIRWLQRRIESTRNRMEFDLDAKLGIYRHLYAAEAFEKFLHSRFVGQKRFSLEGLDTVVPMLHALVEEAGEQGVQEIFLGMAHRGRLNVLTNVLGKPYQAIFTEFEGAGTGVVGDGDVKYHMGYSTEIRTRSNKEVYLALNPNPSHLELVNPVILGKVYSRQNTLGDHDKKRVIPLLLHGDAAFAGQGINMESLQLSRINGYQIGGSVHLILDNQIGFTAEALETRSTRYPTDLLKMAGCPVFHVNADNPEACVHAVRLAVEYRQKFHKDVAVDIIGYRRHGHNEGDEPAFTSPQMYSVIRNHPTVCTTYRNQLLQEGVDEARIAVIETSVNQALETQFEKAKRNEPVELKNTPRFGWEEITRQDKETRVTGVSEEKLNQIVEKLAFVPSEFKANRKVRQFHEQRASVWASDKVDWAFAESLAFASLLCSGFPVRLSGQDCQRGTFTQRNLVLRAEDGEKYVPLQELSEDQAPFFVYNSILSELAVLGFDYGYALNNPNTLVAWEAQFGDFSNGAQSMIDNFIASGESKWGRFSGLVMLLPHGYEGAGPEHSSARLERYLQLCAEDNMRVANCTTPANYFHILRRQVVLKDRKPLILMTPKSLLRHKRVVSERRAFFKDTVFQPVLVGDDRGNKNSSASRLLVMSGKIYYDVLEALEALPVRPPIELIRIEQLYPFPEKEILEALAPMQNIKEVIWVQEEKMNMGGWGFVEPLLREILRERGLEPQYLGRKAGASPATGYSKVHAREQAEIVGKALSGL
ncbi:MAG: 2-oxoglutarate dehydrogenase E1 component [Candidatus Cloacimonetes bacterium]|nr:2-oxoglutarate dehydrogenase E1 component [Candidatus Cloacimonadota bacterium]